MVNNQSVYFTSDTHFGSKRALELSRRSFRSVEEMDNVMIDNWNRTVKKEDIIIHLGDFASYETFNTAYYFDKYLPILNGTILFLTGNYERNDIKNPKNKHEFNESIKRHKNLFLIDEADDRFYTFSSLKGAINKFWLPRIADKIISNMDLPDILMVHEPIQAYNILNRCSYDEMNKLIKMDKYLSSKCKFVLFGHTHGRQMIKRFFKYTAKPKSICGMDVGVDCNYFKPVSVEDIKFYINACNS